MWRPPFNQHGGGGGGFAPPSNYPANPVFSPATGYFQNPRFVPPQLQNPNFVQPPFQNAGFGQPRLQNLSFGQSYNPFAQNLRFPSAPNPGPSRQDVIDRAEGAAVKAHRELVTAGESVSAWKVSQAVLVELKVDSWATLGLQLQDIPFIHRLLITEGKVNAFIHCFIGARRITSLYDLEVAICKNESVEQFEELGLGPLCRHPLAVHYFSIPSDLMEVFKITSEDIIICLQEFLSKCNKQMISAEEFLAFLVEEKSISSKEKLGVRIQSLGLHISFIRKAWKAEKSTLSRSLHKSDKVREREKMNLSRSPDTHMEKKILDRRFGFISNRMKSFSSAWGDFAGKHIRFDSSDIDDEDENDSRIYQNESSSHNKDGGLCVSSCPYPSTTEEMVRLGLKSEADENASPCDGKTMENGGRKSSGKKRKFNQKNGNASSSCKLLKKEEFVNLEENQKKSVHLVLTNNGIEKFITMWKEACRENSMTEVLERMANFYITSNKRLKRIRHMFSIYPGVALLNIAVASIKCGILDSHYDTFQAFGEQGITQKVSARADMIEMGPFTNNNIVLNCNKGTEEPSTCAVHLADVTVDDIIKKIAEFFDSDNLAAIEKVLSPRRQIAYLKKFHDCEIWLITQFSTKQFCSLGHGDFYEFLERHASLLPKELHIFLSGGLRELSCVEASMLQQQLLVLLSQAESNLLKSDAISKSDSDAISKSDVSMLLKKQFPTICFRIVGNEPEKCFTDFIKGHKASGNTNCVIFSSALLGKCQTRSSLASHERPLSESAGILTEVGQKTCSFGTLSFEDAIECLRKVPMLSDLLCWSHWDLIYAPSLGPLMEWLLNEVHNKELFCIATSDGKLVRIDPSSTLDEFLEAMVQCCSYQVALKLLSLLYLYKGTSNVPLSLLKCYAQRAMDVIIRSSVDSKEIKNNEKGLLHTNPPHKLISINADRADSFSNEPLRTFEPINHGSVVCRSLDRTNKAIAMISRFVLECLSHLPSEFRSFAAEILISGLKSFTKDAALHILHECTESSQRIMLHDIGLALGITEWINDYHDFILGAATNMHTSSETLDTDGPPCSGSGDSKHTLDTHEKSFSEDRKALLVNLDASFTDGKQEPLSESHADANLTDDYYKPCNQVYERENDKRVMGEKSDIVDNRIVQEASLFIESIRREEFGLESNLNSTESCLLKKQHARLGRALHCLSQELYSQDAHLLLELVQNADDNVYSENVDPALVFILLDIGIVILNNEQGFSAQNIKALCDIGNSTKKGSTAGYIGHKGIGFKSVFRVTDAPEIHSNGFHVKFDITEGQIGFVLPTVVSPFDSSMFRKSICGEDYERCGTHWNTCIFLPFRSKFKEGGGMSSIISMFSDLHPSLLLFLHRLRCIKFKNMLADTLIVMRKEIQSDGIIKVSHGKETISWLVASKKLKTSAIRHDIQNTEIAMAFTLHETRNGEYKPHLSPQPVFSFLPLRNYGLKFIIQGDFELPSSREEVDGDSAWNQWLLSEFPALFVSAEESFCTLPCFRKKTWEAVTAYMSFVPLIGEVHGFFSCLPHMIISKLRMSKCLLQDRPDTEWVLPCKVLRGWDEQARLLISDSLLQEHLGLVYLHQDVILADSLSRALGIQDYGPKILVDIILSICHKKDGIKSLDLAWLSSWLAILYSTLLVHSAQNAGLEHYVISKLKGVPFIQLSDGSYSSMADGPIWLPCDCFSIGFEGKQSPRDFPRLYAKLRIVSPLLFCADTTDRCKMEDKTTDNLIRMLHKIGVQELSAHEVIKSHILVALTREKYNHKDRDLMIEYLSFIMLHFQYDCAFCCTEKANIISQLQKESILLTNHGYRCPGVEPIHFGKEYGNPVDVFKLIDPVDIIWLEVDGAYLKHPSTKFLPLSSTKWRIFFQELGVTDFVQVNHVDKNVFDDITSGATSCGNFSLASSNVSDWESPEAVKLLSILSSKKYRKKCMYLLEVFDKMWDDCYSAKVRLLSGSKTIENNKTIESSFIKSIHEFRWIASNLNEELHHSKDLFYDCDDVRSILGTMAPYAAPQVTSKLLLKDIGFKTRVTLDDALTVLHSWRKSKAPLMASIAQMLKFYTFISDGLVTSKMDTTTEFLSSPFIYIPCETTSRHNDVVSGMFLSPKEVYWHDPTGCVERTKEVILLTGSFKGANYLPSKALETIYPSLRDFFLNVCGVSYVPTFVSYLEILLQLATVALPSQAAHAVFRVFLKLADDLDSGLVKSEEIFHLKESLLKSENTVLPTLQDKWVSVHPSFGLICWSDDEELTQQFKHSDGVYILDFGELNGKEKELLAGKVSLLLKAIGVAALSEVVSRDAIFYGTVDNSEKYSLINWLLPFAQRYLYKSYPNIYIDLKQCGLKKISQLQVVVVEKLFYKHTLKGRDSISKKRVECSCLLQGNLLYATRTSDYHSMFLELSRFFLNGSAELHLANFLHMITTMAESGSTSEQREFFIVNSQKVPRLPDDEPIWFLSSLLERPDVETSQPICPRPINTEQNISTAQKRPGITPTWPPTDWKTAPDFQYARIHHQLTWPDISTASQNEFGNPHNVVAQVDFPVQIDADWAIEEALPSTGTLVSREPMITKEHARPLQSFDSIDRPINSSLERKGELVEENLADLSTFPESDIWLQTPTNEDQVRKTGRLGETIAYRYLAEKLGSANVKWVNEETETGLPFDLIFGEGEKKEYIEVKTTRYASKGWFLITTREWQFAVEKGDAFSIAHVVFYATKKAKITILRNPVKLCQQNTLSLALLMSKQLKDYSVTT